MDPHANAAATAGVVTRVPRTRVSRPRCAVRWWSMGATALRAVPAAPGPRRSSA